MVVWLGQLRSGILQNLKPLLRSSCDPLCLLWSCPSPRPCSKVSQSARYYIQFVQCCMCQKFQQRKGLRNELDKWTRAKQLVTPSCLYKQLKKYERKRILVMCHREGAPPTKELMTLYQYNNRYSITPENVIIRGN